MTSPPFTVKASFEYTSDHEDDLTFPIGQIVTVTEVEDEGWYFGGYTDESGSKKEGLFPQNFVERYEPPAPPRPSRPHKTKKEPEPGPSTQTAPSAAPTTEAPSGRGSLDSESPEAAGAAPQSHTIAAPGSGTVETSPSAAPAQPPPVEEKVESASKAAPKPAPPPVAEKPTGSSFRDRIAAFNKPAASPVTPLNPNKAASSDAFIKKSFVAPPPSKNAYVPPPQTSHAPPKVYRREEDPEIQDRVAQDQTMTERAEHQTSVPEDQESGEDQPQPTSLKDKIALLQKQQLEQAARNADAAQKKEKPKKPAKKPAETEPQELARRDSGQAPELERTKTSESTETPTEVGEYEAGEQHSHESHVTLVMSPSQPPRELTSDTNDADSSGAGDTEEAEAEETSTSKEDLSDAPRERKQSIPIREKPAPSQPVGHPEETIESRGRDENAEEDEEEEEMDPEVKKRMEIRDRMAKMSGGMGMMGMFGPPGGMSAAPKKPKAQPSGEPERKSSEEERPVPPTKAPPVPVMGLPGMPAKDHETTSPDIEGEDKAALTPVPSAQQQGAGTPQPNTNRAPPPLPPVAQGTRTSPNDKILSTILC